MAQDSLTQQRIAAQKQQLRDAGVSERNIAAMGPSQRSAIASGITRAESEAKRIQKLHEEGRLSPTSIREYQEKGILPGAGEEEYPAVSAETKQSITLSQLKRMPRREQEEIIAGRDTRYVFIPTEAALEKAGKTLEQWSEEAGYEYKAVAEARALGEGKTFITRPSGEIEVWAPHERRVEPPRPPITAPFEKHIPLIQKLAPPPARYAIEAARIVPRPYSFYEIIEGYREAPPKRIPIKRIAEAWARGERIVEPLPIIKIPKAMEPIKYEYGVPPELLGTISEAKIRERERAAAEERRYLEAFAPMPGDPLHIEIAKGVSMAVAGPGLMMGEISRTVHSPEFRAEFGKAPLPVIGKQLYGVGAGFVETAAKYPLYTAALIATPTLIGKGLKRVGLIKPKYKVTYLERIAIAKEWKGVDILWAKAARMEPEGMIIKAYKPPPRITLTRIFTKEFIRKGKPITYSFSELKTAIFGDKGLGALKQKFYAEKIKPITYKAIMKKKPVIEEFVPAVSMRKIYALGVRGIRQKMIETEVLRRGMEILVPIKIPKPKTFMVKRAPPKMPPMKPFKFEVPSYRPISPGAAARAELLMMGFKKPAKVVKARSRPRVSLAYKPMAISAKEMRFFAPYEYISPAAAGIVGIWEPQIMMERPRLKLAYTPAYAAEQRQLEKMSLRLMPRLKAEIRVREKLAPRPKIKPMLAQMQITIPKTDLVMKVAPKLKMKVKPLLALKEKPRVRERFAPIDITLLRVPRVPPPGIFALPVLPKEEFPRFRRRRKRRFPKQPKKYRPSLVGIISGKTIEKELKGMLKGFEVRYPVRRKRKGKRKKKRRK